MTFADLIDRLRLHSRLMARMIERLGIRERIEALPQSQEVLDRAGVRCLTCDHAEKCAAWLTLAVEPEDAPSFCRNRDLFADIGRQPEPGG